VQLQTQIGNWKVWFYSHSETLWIVRHNKCCRVPLRLFIHYILMLLFHDLQWDKVNLRTNTHVDRSEKATREHILITAHSIGRVSFMCVRRGCSKQQATYKVAAHLWVSTALVIIEA